MSPAIAMLGAKVQAKSLVDVVTERLETAIFDGTLAPGSRLFEQTLAASLGVSRGPLREAIRRLEGRKLLQRTPNVGVRVAELSLKSLHETLQVRERLEELACGLAARNMPDHEIAGLAELVEREQRRIAAEGAPHYEVDEDFAFHNRIAVGSRNERLQQMLADDLYSLFQLYSHRLGGRRDRGDAVCAEHEAIVAAIARRDPEAAEAAMRRHLRNARRHVEDQLTADAVDSDTGTAASGGYVPAPGITEATIELSSAS